MGSTDYQRHASSHQRKRMIKRILVEGLVCGLLITAGIFLPKFVIKFIGNKISNAVKLEPNSTGFHNWLNPPINTTRSYHLFNISNWIEVNRIPQSATIQVQDTPPHTYDIKTKKINVTWSNDNQNIHYGVERLFARHPTKFNPSSVNDTGVFINMLRTIFRTQFQIKPAQSFYELAEVAAFHRRNITDLLEGFQSDLFNTMKQKMIGPNTNMSGLIYRQNGSELYNVSIETDQTKRGQVLTFNNRLVSFNILNSSHYQFPIYDGLTFPPDLFDKPSLNIFNSDFCRPVLVQFNRELMYEGVNVHEYKIKLINHENCTDLTDTNTCEEVDQLDVSKCISDSLPDNTMFLSKAHFYGANEKTIQEMNIKGFTPTAEKHDSFVYFEPYSGTPCKAIYRMQLNIDARIDPIEQSRIDHSFVSTTRKSVRRLVPIFWIDQEVKISEEIINKFKKITFFINCVKYGSLLIAIGLSIGFIILMEIMAKRTDKKNGYARGVNQY